MVVIQGEVLPCKSFSSINQPVIAPAKIDPITAKPIAILSTRTVNKNFKLLSFRSFNFTNNRRLKFLLQVGKIPFFVR